MPQQTDLGTVQIHNEVIGTIASLAAQEVPGVLGVWDGPLPDPLKRWIKSKGVKVETSNGEARVWINLVVEYGSNLSDVAVQVQDRARDMIEQMTGLTAAEVHVNIHHVKVKRSS